MSHCQFRWSPPSRPGWIDTTPAPEVRCIRPPHPAGTPHISAGGEEHP